MDTVSQYSGWFAIAYLIIKDIFVPAFRKSIPAKVKNESDQLRHSLAMEEKKLEADLATQERLTRSIEELTKTQAQQTELSRVTNERLNRIEDGQKEILTRLPRPTRKAAK